MELRTRFWIFKTTVLTKRGGSLSRMSRSVSSQTSRIDDGSASRRKFETAPTNIQGCRSRLRTSLFDESNQGRRRGKRSDICAFSLASTPELCTLKSLHTDSFISAFIRMTARRDTPMYVASNHGTNFVDAKRELREQLENLIESSMKSLTEQNHQ